MHLMIALTMKYVLPSWKILVFSGLELDRQNLESCYKIQSSEKKTGSVAKRAIYIRLS